MAAAQANLQNAVGNNINLPHDKFEGNKCIRDAPSVNGMLIEKHLRETLQFKVRNGVSLLTTAEGNDPGAGGAGGAVVQQGFADRQSALRTFLLSACEDGSTILRTLSDIAIFTNGQEIWTYIIGGLNVANRVYPTILYRKPPDSEARKHKQMVQNWTYLNLPVTQQDKFLCSHYKIMLEKHNPLEHPTFVIPEIDLLTIWGNGLHPHAKNIALTVLDSDVTDANSYARQNSCCYPATFPAHHPNAGAAQPNANTLSFAATCNHVQQKFIQMVDSNVFSLKGQPMVNLLDASGDGTPEPSVLGQGDAIFADNDGYMFASWKDIVDAGYDRERNSFAEYAIHVLNREQRQMRTCNNCGGVNHFSVKDGNMVCPTPQGSVPTALLSRIRYPVGVNPWRFTNDGGKGKGKGKGIGKGAKGKGGRGRGGYWVYQEPEAGPDDTSNMETEETEPAVQWIDDDHSGWNE